MPRIKIKLRPPTIGDAEPDYDLALARLAATHATVRRQVRRRFGKWTRLVVWAAEQKIARDNEANRKEEK